MIKENAKKETKTAAAKKTVKAPKAQPAKKAPKKAEEQAPAMHIEHILELDGMQISTAEMEKKVLEAYAAEGGDVSAITSVQMYYNLGERHVYYVVNGTAAEKYVEF